MKISWRTTPHKRQFVSGDLRACSRYWSIRTFVQPLRNNNLSVYVSRCKQSSNQSQPIVILMLVRLNGKNVYRSFLSLCHTHAHSLSLSPLRLVRMSSSTPFRARYSTLSFIFFFFPDHHLSSFFQLSLFSAAHIERPARKHPRVRFLFAGFVEVLPWTTRCVLETSGVGKP